MFPQQIFFGQGDTGDLWGLEEGEVMVFAILAAFFQQTEDLDSWQSQWAEPRTLVKCKGVVVRCSFHISLFLASMGEAAADALHVIPLHCSSNALQNS